MFRRGLTVAYALVSAALELVAIIQLLRAFRQAETFEKYNMCLSSSIVCLVLCYTYLVFRAWYLGLLAFGRYFGLFAFWSFGLLAVWSFGLLVFWPLAFGLLIFGLLIFWSSGILDYWSFGRLVF